ASHHPLAGVRLELGARDSDWSQRTLTDVNGEFAFPAVPLGDYRLSASHDGFVPSMLSLTVVTGAAPVIHLQLVAPGQPETVTVTSSVPASADSFTPRTIVDRGDIAHTPGADRTNSLALITDFVPGAYFVHDQLHVRGGHQTSWEIDGAEIPNTNIAGNLGPQIDPKDIAYLETQRGSYGADQGDRTYGVFNVVPRNGFERNDEGELIVSGGSFGQTNDALSVGGHSADFAYYGSLDGDRSALGLMTPVGQIIHDGQDGYGAFTTLIYNAAPADQLRLVVSARRDDYRIPNTPGETVDDTQREADVFTILSWVHTFDSRIVLTSSLLYHYNRADFDGGARDFPISTTDRHSSSYFGAQQALRASFACNQLSAGVFGFGQSDDQYFHVLFNDGSLPAVAQSLRPQGNVEALYVQDTCHVTSWLTLSAGVRHTHFSGLVTENATDPRLGLTLRLPGSAGREWVMRGFWGRYYQPPPLETLSGPLLQFARESALAFLPLHGERDEEWQVGLSVPLSGWTLDLDHFRTRARNFFDHNPIGNSDVFLPITITGALITASELAVRSPRFWAGASFHLAWSNQTADGLGAITGGLTNFAPPAGYYALDHDQRNTVNAGLEFELPHAVFAAANLYYGSGFSNGHAPPSHLPSHASLDLSAGWTFRRDWTASITLLNVTDRHLLVDNSLTFDGFHYDNPREIYAEIRYRFHY
ncbi:MAG: TonB-dependent receptor, partial [Gammaproteobacteria bacterium]|nr:TonB-dependent receptor [Gammaproteobacteria bacterium]